MCDTIKITKMSVSTPLISFSDGVGKDIDDFRFQRGFFKNLRGAYNQSVNPFARTRIVDSPNEFQYVFPRQYNNERELVTTTLCCDHPNYSVVVGRKMGDDPTEGGVLAHQLVQRGPRKTTGIIGLNVAENS